MQYSESCCAGERHTRTGWRRFPSAAALLVGILLLLTQGAARLMGDEVARWNEITSRASLASGLFDHPLFDSRVFAMTHLAVHDSLNTIDRRYRPYRLEASLRPGASPAAAVATAAHHVLVNQYGLLAAFGFVSQKAMLDGEYAASLSGIPNGPAKDAGITVGSEAAGAILALRSGDGWNQQTIQDFAYKQGTAPGEYRFTPPATFAFMPDWGKLQPFSLFRADQYRPSPPYRVDSKRYAADFNEVKALGGDGMTTPSARTPDQTQIAMFWYESSPIGWNRIARIVSAKQPIGLWESGRLFALLNLASADGYIAVFDTKYHYKYWRPITAIRLADSDGNPATTANPTWTPLLPTPAVPDYSSGHSVEGGAAAEIMKLFFGTNAIAFSTCSTTLPAGSNCNEASEVRRSFPSFSAAAEENALSRVLVGIHFRNACDEGIKQGHRIAHHTFVHYLRPLR